MVGLRVGGVSDRTEGGGVSERTLVVWVSDRTEGGRGE